MGMLVVPVGTLLSTLPQYLLVVVGVYVVLKQAASEPN